VRIGVICGGRSAEHDISLRSARSVATALAAREHQVEVIYITDDGRWQRVASSALLDGTLAATHALSQQNGNASPVAGSSNAEELTLVSRGGTAELLSVGSGVSLASLDVVFPVLHGPYGEDGTIQGMLRMAGVPFIGADVLGSALSMDKDVSKRLLRAATLPVAAAQVVRAPVDARAAAELIADLGLPLFIKPANLGSSVGVSKVSRPDELPAAITLALRYDDKVLVEEFVAGRELEVSIVGNETPRASAVGEIVTTASHQFYSYQAKYLDPDGAQLLIPAPIPTPVADEVRRLACAAYTTLGVEGMARVDFFWRRNNAGSGGEFEGADALVINEINTIPGFTDISMFAKLWAASGLGFGELIEELADLELLRHRRLEERAAASQHRSRSAADGA
jgi:D-alanine-D-alanine ligase